MESSVTIRSGGDAWALLSDSAFTKEWELLFDECPWATAYQSFFFVSTWFDNYRDRYTPLLVYSRDRRGCLTGLLSLAIQGKKRLVAAGAYQAVYQVWLARPENRKDFITGAMAALQAAYPGHALALKYLPGETPLQALRSSPLFSRRVQMKTYRRPLMRLDPDAMAASLKKKGNKRRVNNLRRRGNLEFKHITDEKAFAGLMDKMITCYDFRQGGTYGVPPFEADPNKKPFYLDMMRKHSGHFHASALLLNNSLIAAQLDLIEKKRLHLGISAICPLNARYSSGKMLMLYLGRHLAGKGIQWFDLTPGGDPWKERFANHHDDVYEMIFHGSATARLFGIARTKLTGWIKRGLASVLSRPVEAWRICSCIKEIRLKRILKKILSFFWKNDELRLYRRDEGGFLNVDIDNPPLQRDSLPDLLRYRSSDIRQTRADFLSTAFNRFLNSEHVYSQAANEELSFYVWRVENPQKAGLLASLKKDIDIPKNSILLHDLYFQPNTEGCSSLQENLKRVLLDAGSEDKMPTVFMSVRAGDVPDGSFLKELGFEHHFSIFRTRRFGVKREITCYPAAKTCGKETSEKFFSKRLRLS